MQRHNRTSQLRKCIVDPYNRILCLHNSNHGDLSLDLCVSAVSNPAAAGTLDLHKYSTIHLHNHKSNVNIHDCIHRLISTLEFGSSTNELWRFIIMVIHVCVVLSQLVLHLKMTPWLLLCDLWRTGHSVIHLNTIPCLLPFVNWWQITP